MHAFLQPLLLLGSRPRVILGGGSLSAEPAGNYIEDEPDTTHFGCVGFSFLPSPMAYYTEKIFHEYTAILALEYHRAHGRDKKALGVFMLDRNRLLSQRVKLLLDEGMGFGC